MNNLNHKKVELTELFYDLVFVYVISQITEQLHHFVNGIIPVQTIIIFVLSMLIFINSWMVQSVFTNRFGKNSLVNILFMLAQMFISMFAATTIYTNDPRTFQWAAISMAIISFLL